MQSRILVQSIGCMTIAIFLAISSGCSLIGLGIGAASDASKPDTPVVADLEALTIREGTPCSITMANGDQVVGRFAGTQTIPKEEYAEKYAASRGRDKGSIYLPVIGDTILLKLTTDRELRGIFSGFNRSQIEFRRQDPGEIRRLSLNTIDVVSDNREEHMTKGETLRRLLSTGEIAQSSEIVIQHASGEHSRVPLDEISLVELPVRKRGKQTGLAVGALLDVAVVLYFACCFELDFDFQMQGDFGLSGY